MSRCAERVFPARPRSSGGGLLGVHDSITKELFHFVWCRACPLLPHQLFQGRGSGAGRRPGSYGAALHSCPFALGAAWRSAPGRRNLPRSSWFAVWRTLLSAWPSFMRAPGMRTHIHTGGCVTSRVEGEVLMSHTKMSCGRRMEDRGWGLTTSPSFLPLTATSPSRSLLPKPPTCFSNWSDIEASLSCV